MSALEELRELGKELESDPEYVGVAFFVGLVANTLQDEELARDALILLKGSENAVDISEEIL